MKMTNAEYAEAQEEYHGYCSNCDRVTKDSGVEPDARGYKCDECHLHTVMGMEEAIIDGRIVITD